MKLLGPPIVLVMPMPVVSMVCLGVLIRVQGLVVVTSRNGVSKDVEIWRGRLCADAGG